MLVQRLQAGTIVADRFVLERLAGAGGMGEVYRARDRATGGVVALKLLHAGDRTHVARFLREARVLARLEHPNVVRYVAHGEGPVFIAMEWLEGEDLARRLSRGRLSVAETLELARPIAHGLAAAHARNVIHRDVKPSNVFLVDGRLGAAKVLDFGIAHLSQGTMAAVTATGQLVGTLGYMAPEQAAGEITARVDAFSFGCVLFECLTGRTPFPGDRVMEVLAKILFAEAPRVGELRDGVPPALEQLIAKMMSNVPSARPMISDVVATLEAIGAPDAQTSTLSRAHDAAEPAGELPAVTSEERSLVAIVLADERASTATAPTISIDLVGKTDPSLGEALSAFGASVERSSNGRTTAVLGAAGGEAVDLAARAARASLALRRTLPRTRVAVALGRVTPSSDAPLGEVVARAERLLARDGATVTLALVTTGAAATQPHTTADEREPAAPALEAEPSAPDGIRLDPTIAALLDARFEVVRDGHRPLLAGELPPGGAPWSAPRSAVPFIGREREAKALEALVVERAGQPPACVVLVTGPAGSGKSRLGREVLARLPRATWTARGDAATQDRSFATLDRLLAGLAGAQPDDAPDVRRRKLSACVARWVSADDVAWVTDTLVAAAVAETRPTIDNARSPLRGAEGGGDVGGAGARLQRAWEALLGGALREGPVVLVLEDLHDCDRASAQLLFASFRALADTPLVVLAFARPEVHAIHPGLFAGTGAHEIRLGGLTPSEARRLADAAVGDARQRAVASSLAARAGTSAFHVAEVARVAAEGESSLPETVLASAQAELERLAPSARRVLRAGSVLGDVFWTSAIATLLGAEAAATLGATLAALVDADLIVRRPESRFAEDEEHSFRRPIAREAAYAMLTARDRTAAHRLAAEWLESRGERDAVVLAEHFERGGEPKSAVVWFLWAAEQAFEANDLETAVARAKRGIAAGAEGSTLGELLLLQAEAIGWTDGAPLAVHTELATSSMEFLARGTGAWCRAVAQVAVARARAGDRPGLEQAAARLVAAAPDPSLLGVSPVLAITRVAAELYVAGLPDAADPVVAWVRAAAPLSHPDDAETIGVAARWVDALHALHHGDPSAHAEAGPALATAFEQSGHPRFAPLVLSFTARAFHARGSTPEAAAWAQRAAELADRLALRPTAARARALIADPNDSPAQPTETPNAPREEGTSWPR